MNEKKNPDDPSSVTADVVELTDIVIAAEDGVYGLGRIRLTGVAATANIATGRHPLSRVAPLTDLLFSIWGGLTTIAGLVKERLLPGGEVAGTEALASAIAARLEQRLGLGLTIDGVLLEGLVIPGIAAVDRVQIGGSQAWMREPAAWCCRSPA